MEMRVKGSWADAGRVLVVVVIGTTYEVSFLGLPRKLRFVVLCDVK